MRFFVPVVIVVHGVAALLGTSSFAAEPHPSLPPAGTTDGLGVNIHFTDPRAGEMEMLGGGGFRWVRMDFTWSRTERQRGVYDFSPYDRLLEALEAEDIRALFILDYSNRLYEEGRSVSTEEGRMAFAQWAAAAARRFQGRGILWEIWNEPNISKFWGPEPNVDHYSKMALAAAKAIREVAPGEAVIGPATSQIDMEFLEGCFRAGLLEHWDAVSVHPYRQSAPETVAVEYRRLRRLIERYGPEGKPIPIISGEWGYSAAWGRFDAERQGKMLPRQWLTNMAGGVPLSIWYDWHDDGPDPHEAEHNFGTVGNKYHASRTPCYDPKPAYLAAQGLTSTLRGYRFVKRVAVGSADDYAMVFSKRDEPALAVWTTAEKPHELTIPSDPCRFEVTGHTGQPREPLSTSGGVLRVTVSDAPQYLVAEGPNRRLMAAPEAFPLRAEIMPLPGKALSVQIENLAARSLDAVVRLVDASGVEPLDAARPVRLSVEQPRKTIRFPLAAAPSGECGVGLQVADAAGNVVLRVPRRRFVFLSDDLLAGCRIVGDGDAEVEAELGIEKVGAPEPLPGLDSPPVKISYRFGQGWKFARLVSESTKGERIAGKPRALGFWVFGDGNGTTAHLRVRDATGQTWQPSGPRIDWRGWRFVKLPLARAGHWGGADDGRIHFPLTWDSVFVLDNPTREPNRGAVYVAAPVIFY